MEPTTREQFIGRVREALQRRAGDAVPAPPAVTDELARLTGDGEPLVDLFERRAGEVGMKVVRTTVEALADDLVALLRGIEAESIVLGVDRLEQAPAIRGAIESAGIGIGQWRGDRAMTASYAADAGVTDVAAALAESGSLVYTSDAQHGRSLMLAPPVHVAIVRASDVLADMLDYLRPLGDTTPAGLPASQTIITGPSKTADIEGILVTGVHGPGAVHVLLVADA